MRVQDMQVRDELRGSRPTEDELVRRFKEGEPAFVGSNLIVRDLMVINLAYFELSVRAYECLWDAGCKYLGDLIQKSRKDLLEINKLGPKSADKIEEILFGFGLELGIGLPLHVLRAWQVLRAEADVRHLHRMGELQKKWRRLRGNSRSRGGMR